MLRGIPPILCPDLLHVLASMGHGDELVLADGNFPAATNARRLVRADGHGVPALLQAVCRLVPLDTYVDNPAAVMALVPGDNVVPTIWDDYRRILSEVEGRRIGLAKIERQAFYERAREAFAVVATGETALYANIIIVKGVVV